VQQLRDGLNNFFVTFIEVLEDRKNGSMNVEPDVTSGDYLSGFLLGTREALFESGRESVTVTVRKVSPFSVGVLIALFERSVGLYASLINVNAYHQPGVEAGKKAASAVIELQLRIQAALSQAKGRAMTIGEIATAVGRLDESETIFKICEHLSANPGRGIAKTARRPGFDSTYRMV
jgi:glucose-6-phosphate isomerase